ncbi:MAG: NYN domain-containing protein [Candidatus Omnitrophota bacterium]
MSLQYIIDGYNVVRHAAFTPPAHVRHKEPELLLAETIRIGKLCGSSRNTVMLVFDGYPRAPYQRKPHEEIEVLYSHEESADERIKQLAAKAANPKNVIVVSDDREIRFFVRSLGVTMVSVEQFLTLKQKRRIARESEESYKTNLTSSEMAHINKELRKLWLEE